jgi:asparagine synthase (glutamine-hydrolysing)
MNTQTQLIQHSALTQHSARDLGGLKDCHTVGMVKNSVDGNCESALNFPKDRHERTEMLFWDGRLDNRTELLPLFKDSLQGETSNAALAVASYERWGAAGFAHLIGDWSMVIRDEENRTVILASDFAGVRPLYYCVQAERVLWSSDLQSLVNATGISELDEQYAHAFVLFGGCPNRTPYRNIYSVPPGHALHVCADEVKVHRFWSLPVGDEIRYRDERRYIEQLRAVFQEAVAVRLQNHSPVLAELSGGLDSSSVVSMANHLIRSGSVGATRLTGVSYVWPNSLDEPFIHEVESYCGVEGVHISTREVPLVSETQLGDAMPEVLQPLRAASAAIAGKLGATTFLTGQNGDLMMGNWFDDSLHVAASLRHFQFGRAWREAIAWSKVLRLPVYSILGRAFRAALPPSLSPAALYTAHDGSYTPKSDETSLRHGLGEDGPESFFSKEWIKAAPERRKYFHGLSIMLELRMLQAPGPLQHLDYTHPFAHRPLVEFLMAVPTDVLCRPGEPRRLMRSALSDLWPPKLRTRRSKGLFNTPWQEALQPLAHLLLRDRHWHLVERGFVDRASLLSRLQRLCAGLDCNQSQLRQIIMLELWLRSRSDSEPKAQEAWAA